MTFACQRDSYIKKLETKVVSCALSSDEDDQYIVVLEDTILFPEGGGQPDDRGTINGIPVNAVKRRELEALHYIDEPLDVGENVVVEVDWSRRFDHMQQHTAQHLITAVVENQFHYYTTSWCLGEQASYIELDVAFVKNEDILKLEQDLNEKIRNGAAITMHLYGHDAPELTQVRSRLKLPEDHIGPVRVVCIEGIDNNTCCGTHVKNISELQAIKLLYAEKGKKRNKTNVWFVAGERVLNYLAQSVTTEQALISLLNCTSDEIVEFVRRLQKSLKIANKGMLLAMRDLAVAEAKLFNLQEKKPKFFSTHKKGAEPEFMSIFLNEVDDNETTLFFLTVGDFRTGGQLALSGPEKLVEKYGPEICEILNGKGSFKNGKYQGKFQNLSNIPKAEELLKSVIEE